MESADCVAGMEHAHCDEVGDDSRECGSDGEEEPAVSLPEFTEAGGLGEDICDVGCAVSNVCYDRQEEKAQAEIQREYCLRRGISSGEVDDYDGRERKVVNEPPTFPEFNGISDVLPHVGVHGDKSNSVRAASVQRPYRPAFQHRHLETDRLIFDDLGNVLRRLRTRDSPFGAQWEQPWSQPVGVAPAGVQRLSRRTISPTIVASLERFPAFSGNWRDYLTSQRHAGRLATEMDFERFQSNDHVHNLHFVSGRCTIANLERRRAIQRDSLFAKSWIQICRHLNLRKPRIHATA
jgi:hypothetical protein